MDYPFILGTTESVNWYNEEYSGSSIFSLVTFKGFIHNGKIRKKAVQTISREFLIALVAFWKATDGPRAIEALKAAQLLESWLNENPEKPLE